MDLLTPAKSTVIILVDNNGRRYTNNHNLSDIVISAILKDRYTDEEEDPFDYSASTITSPIQQTIFKIKRPEGYIVRDVTSLFYQFMGSVAHQVLEDAWQESHGGVVEQRLYTIINGKVIAGKMDHYKRPKIGDYKSCKVYKIQKAKYEDWEAQQNVYAYLCFVNEMVVTEITITALIFDWKKGEAWKKNYPQSPIVDIDLPVWPVEDAKAYISGRVFAIEAALVAYDHAEADEAGDSAMMLASNYPCSKREMWQDIKDYSVMKPGAKKATRSLDSREECAAYMEEKGYSFPTYEIVERWTERTRCYDWCDYAHICEQNKALFIEEGKDHAEHYNL